MYKLMMGVIAVTREGILYRVTDEDGQLPTLYAKGPAVADADGPLLNLPFGSYTIEAVDAGDGERRLVIGDASGDHQAVVLREEPREAKSGWLVFGSDYTHIDGRLVVVQGFDTFEALHSNVANGHIKDVAVYIGIPLDALVSVEPAPSSDPSDDPTTKENSHE